MVGGQASALETRTRERERRRRSGHFHCVGRSQWSELVSVASNYTMKSESGQIVCKHPSSGAQRIRSEATPPPPATCPPWSDSPPCIPQHLISLQVLSFLANNLALPLCSQVIFSYYLAISDVNIDFFSTICSIVLMDMAVCKECASRKNDVKLKGAFM